MRYVSLFSGIEAASVAWESLGWEPVAFSEIEPFPCELLAQRFPNVPNLGDIMNIDWSEYAGTVDLVVGGSPCQSFSIAGNREGLAGESGLMFEYIRAVRELRPRWFVWENVPGALSSEGGAAFGQLLAEMDELGYGLAWRVLDAQFFGVAQRRRRVFLVGSLGDMRAAEVLFERESLRWDHPSSREKRESLTTDAESRSGNCYTLLTRCGCAGGGKGALIQKNVSATLSTSNMQTLFQCLNPWDVQSKRVYAHDSISPTLPSGTSEGMNIQPIVCIPFDTTQITSKVNGNNPQWGDPCHCLTSAGHEPTVCIASTNANAEIDEGLCGTITRRSHKDAPVVSEDYAVRRLTPTECERLQGFPDGWTDIEFKGKPASDTARYKALGNSMAVSVMEWIGKRIEKTNQ